MERHKALFRLNSQVGLSFSRSAGFPSLVALRVWPLFGQRKS